MSTPREKSPLPEKNSPQRRIEPMTLHLVGQRAEHTTSELFLPPTVFLGPCLYVVIGGLYQIQHVYICSKDIPMLFLLNSFQCA